MSPLMGQDGSLPSLTVSSTPTNEGLIGLTVDFTLSSPAEGGERIFFDIEEGTATSADFIPFNGGIIDFAAGTTSESFIITMIDDEIAEADETIQITAYDATGLTLANAVSFHTILNDDASAIRLSSFFSDGMVLQREKGAPVFGYVVPSSTVTVQFAGETYQTVADSNGRFEVSLENLAASSVGRDLVISSDGITETISGVLVGEVWMGAGQSNMDFPLNFLPSPENDNASATSNDPLLKIFVPTETARGSRQDLVSGNWLAAVPGETSDFSALAYYYGKRLREELGVPVAIMECAWGGQPIQGFISEEKLATFPEGIELLETRDFFYGIYAQALADFEAALAAWNENPVGPEPVFEEDDPNVAANLGGQIYNGMVAPMVGYGMRGILWYQGEANTFDFASQNYQPLLEALAEDWRERWGEELPFYFVQLPNFVSEARTRWVEVQNAMRLASATIPNSGMVVGNDIGDPEDIHPINKSDFAERLVLWPLANEYGLDSLLTSGPAYSESFIQGSSVVVEFDFSSGLATRGGGPLGGFELREEEGDWVSANASIIGESVVVSVPGMTSPTAVRYAWAQNPTAANLINSANLPSSVFEATPTNSPIDITLTTSAEPIDEGFIGLVVNLSLSSPAIGGESFNFELQDGTAVAGEDFIFWENGFFEFAPGETSQSILLTVLDDSIAEEDETFTFAITNPSGLTLAQSEITLTIFDDDEPVAPEPAVLSVSADPINENFIGLVVNLTLSEPATGNESFNFELQDGTAVAGEDFIALNNGFFEFAPGETSQSILLTVLNDSISEEDETFSFDITSSTNLILSQSATTLTILDDDVPVVTEPPVLTVSADPTSESANGLAVNLTLSKPATGTENFYFELEDGTAVAGEDFVYWNGGFVEFEAGETSRTLLVTLLDDSSAEDEETFTFAMANSTDLILSQSAITLTILDDDVPVVTEPPVLTVSADPTSESANGLAVNLTLSKPATGTENFYFELEDGTAVAGEDFVYWNGGFVEFEAGETSRTLLVTLLDDSSAEDEETFTFAMANSTDLILSQSAITLTILDDDVPVVTEPPVLTVSADPTSESANGLAVNLTLSKPATGTENFYFELEDGTAVAGEDFVYWNGGFVEFEAGETSRTLLVTLLDDSSAEDEETFTFAMANSTDLILSQSAITLTILDDDVPVVTEPPVLTVSADPTSESANGLAVNLTLSKPATGTENFYFELEDGTAVAGEDFVYWNGGFVEFEAGETSRTLLVTLLDDSSAEDEETFTFAMANSTDLILSQSAITLTILDDDAPVVTEPAVLTVSANPINENFIGLTVNLSLSRPATGSENFYFELQDGTAIAGEDFLYWNGGFVEFAPGETSQTLLLTVLDDAKAEDDEFFTFAISNPTDLTLAQTSISLTILDDDPSSPEPPILTVTTEPRNEGLIGLPVTFTLSAPALGGESIGFSTEKGEFDMANPLEDYLPWTSGSLEFSPGDISRTIYLTMFDDAITEPDETFTLALSHPNGVVLNKSSLSLTIINDDTVLDDYGNSFGLPPEERLIDSDGDGDGISFFIEYAFNLNPTKAESPDYVRGQTLENGEPFGQPVLRSEVHPITGEKVIMYTYIRRTDSYPKVIYHTEVSEDAVNFTVIEPDFVTVISPFWEEVQVIIGTSTNGSPRCFVRVRVEAEDLNGDGV
ncbi:MAG: Calx-beta domain-containing protein [Roseibacillus sp.]